MSNPNTSRNHKCLTTITMAPLTGMCTGPSCGTGGEVVTMGEIKYIHDFVDTECNPIIIKHTYDSTGILTLVEKLYPDGTEYTGDIKVKCDPCSPKNFEYVTGYTDEDGKSIIARHEYDNSGFLVDVVYMYITGEMYKGVVKDGGNTVKYNTPDHKITSSTPIIIPANTAHSLSYQVFGGTMDVSIGGVTSSYPNSSTGMFEADILLDKEYIFTPNSGATIIIQIVS